MQRPVKKRSKVATRYQWRSPTIPEREGGRERDLLLGNGHEFQGCAEGEAGNGRGERGAEGEEGVVEGGGIEERTRQMSRQSPD